MQPAQGRTDVEGRDGKSKKAFGGIIKFVDKDKNGEV